MITALFTVLAIWLFVKLFVFAAKLAWGTLKGIIWIITGALVPIFFLAFIISGILPALVLVAVVAAVVLLFGKKEA